jgi:hypothetical protein
VFATYVLKQLWKIARFLRVFLMIRFRASLWVGLCIYAESVWVRPVWSLESGSVAISTKRNDMPTKYRTKEWHERKSNWVRTLIRRAEAESLDGRVYRNKKEPHDPVLLIHCCAIMECQRKGCGSCNYGPNGMFPVCEQVEKLIGAVM